jgi:hypothetical protein
MPRLPFNHHATVRAGAHKDDRGYRERGGEAKLAPYPYRHEPPVAQGIVRRFLSTVLSSDRFSSSLTVCRAGRQRDDGGDP